MEEGNLKIVFSEILRGYTLVNLSDFGTVKIKHFNNFDSAELDLKNRFFYDKAVSQGLPTRKERIDHLLDEDIWTEKKNKEILNLKSLIAGLKNSKSKVFLQVHIDQINNDLKKSQAELSTLSLKKEELIGFCAEAYAARRINEHYMHRALLRENGKKLFTNEDFEELEEGKLVDLIGAYNKSTKKFNSNNLKRLSVSGFFTNLFYLCENNAYSFFGKPLVQLSFYQIELFGYGRYYKSLIENSDNKPPDEISSDPEKMVEWFESSKNVKETLDKSKVVGQDGASQSLVGATTQDLKRLGLDNPNETINLAKKAAEKGGRLNMEDMMKLHGVS